MTTEASPLQGQEQERQTRPGMAHDRVAIVTGGTRGIGAAICRELAGQGAHVASAYITGQIWAVNGGLDM